MSKILARSVEKDNHLVDHIFGGSNSFHFGLISSRLQLRFKPLRIARPGKHIPGRCCPLPINQNQNLKNVAALQQNANGSQTFAAYMSDKRGSFDFRSQFLFDFTGLAGAGFFGASKNSIDFSFFAYFTNSEETVQPLYRAQPR